MGCTRKCLGAGREADPRVGCNRGLQQERNNMPEVMQAP